MSTEPDTTLKIESEFNSQGIDEASAAVQKVSTEVSSATPPELPAPDVSGIEAASTAAAELTSKEGEVSAASAGAGSALNALSGAASATAGAEGGLSKSTGDATAAVNASTEAAKAATASLGEESSALSGAAGAAGELATAETDLTTAETDLATTVQDATASIEEATAAKQEEIAASQEASETEEALRVAMELEGKTAAELKAKMSELAAKLKEAAAAGKPDEYKKLTNQYNQCKQALGKFNETSKLGAIAMLQQGQAGLQVAGTLGGLADKLRDGTASAGDFAGAIIAVSMAIKAGLGPIGWLLMAIQGLQMAWDWYADSQEEARKKEEERVKALEEAERQHAETLEKLAEAQRGLLLEGWKKDIEDLKQEQEDARKTADRERQRAEQAATQEDARRKTAAKAVYDQEKARLDTLVASGQMTAKEAEERRRAAEDQLNLELANIDKAAIHRRNSAEVQAIYAAEREAEELEAKINETYGKFDDVLKVQMPSSDEWEALQLKLQSGEWTAKDMAMSDRITRQADEIQKALAEMGITIAGGPEEIIAFLQKMREGKEQQEAIVRQKREEAENHRTAARASKEEAETAAQAAEAQRKTLEAQRAVADAREEAARLQEEWTGVSRKSYAEQREWLEKQLSGMKEGSDLWKKYNEKLQAVKASEIAESLGKINEEYKVSRTYAVKKNKTETQILATDMANLEARRRKLQSVLATKDLDRATLEKANKALKDTEEQIAGCRQAMQENAKSARKWLKELKPPRLQGKNKMMQRSLDNLGKGYKAAAKRASEAARKGDTKALERAQKQMGVYARGMQRLAKNPAAADKMHRQAMQQVAAARSADAENAKASKSSAKSAKDKAKHARAGAASEAASAKSAKDKAKADKEAASAAKKAVPKNTGENPTQKIASLNNDVKALRGQVDSMSGEVSKLGPAIGELASACSTLASAAKSALSACSSSSASLRREIEGVKRAVEKLRTK